MQEMQVRSLAQEDPLEEEMATHSSNLCWEIPWTEKPGGLRSMGSQRESDTTERLNSYNCRCKGRLAGDREALWRERGSVPRAGLGGAFILAFPFLKEEQTESGRGLRGT